jgi:uncharacterized protein (TIGR03437 family)
MLKVMLLTVIATASAQLAVAQGSMVVATSGASFEVGLPAAGSIASIFCAGLSSIGQSVSADSLPLPTQLAGVQVKISGVPAPLFSVTPIQNYFQINLQVPKTDNLEPTAEIRIEQGLTVLSAIVPRKWNTSGEFFRTREGFGIFQHAGDYSPVTADNPARAGDALIAYLTGLLEAQPAVPDGNPSPLNPLSVVPQYNYIFASEAYSIEIGGAGVTPQFLGLAPGLVGVYQLNFTMPMIPSGNVPVKFVRTSCHAIFATCNGRMTNVYTSGVVLLPSR